MFDSLAEMFSFPFMQRALLGGVMIGATCAFLSVFVVLRRMAFVGQGISHAAFGGVALSVLAGFHPMTGAMVFALGTALAIGGFSRRPRVAEDSTIGIFLAVAMALGILFLGFKEGSTSNLFGYLFGSILSILPGDLPWILALAGVVFLVLLAFVKELYFYVFDEDMARVSGIPVDRLYFALLVILAVTVVASIKLVGVILVTALLVMPGAAARLWTTHFGALITISVAAGVVSIVTGLTLAYILDLSPGAMVVLVLFALFLFSMLVTAREG
jgi:ABC-type Mn2+/Zn2+ transport system permease subunit